MQILKLIKTIDDYQLTIFNTQELAEIMEADTRSVQNHLETLANNELIIRLEKGKYCRSLIDDRCVIGSNLVQGGVVAYASAMKYHGLVYQENDEVHIASAHQKVNKTILGFKFRFIKIRPHKYFGIQEVKRPDGRFLVFDREKSLLDCFDLPKYASSFTDLVHILRSERFNHQTLFQYGLKLNNLSILKRIAYLSEKFEIPEFSKFQNNVHKILNEKYDLLDPTGSPEGSYLARWRIRDNMPKQIDL